MHIQMILHVKQVINGYNDSLFYTLWSMSRYVMIYIVKNIKVNTLCLDSL